MNGALLVERRGDVHYLRLNRPERRNALDPAMIDALDAAIASAASDPGVRAVVIAGEGPSFCAGADLNHLHAVARDGRDPMPFLRSVSACFDRIEQAPVPVVGVLHGHAVAGGLELALACDVVLAHPETLIGDGHVRNGLLPAGGSTVRLARKVGEPLARWLMLTGRLLPAEEFVASGFVHRVIDPERAEAALADVLDSLREPAKSSQHRLKSAINQQTRLANAEALRVEHDAFVQNWDRGELALALARFADR